MSIAFRAIFWIAIVSAFAPAAVFSSEGMTAPDDISEMIEQGQRLHQVCTDLPALCDLASEAGGLVTIAASESLDRVDTWLDEREHTSADAS
ncbi:hypothetical protein [Hyphobacterium sp.]|uniref:hypothetical protein n=1 Tax=Hyphobacterium sp. TaxID=2004662 RepID=UPI003BAACC27